MARHAAFLRGINVGGRKATSDQLRAAFEELGLHDVATFRASGNIVFEAQRKLSASQIETSLRAALDFEVTVFLRTAAEVRDIARHEPFDARQLNSSKGKLQVVLLPKKPSASAQKRVLAIAGDDRFAFRGRDVYWLPAAGLMDSAVGMQGISDTLGSNTVRTKATIDQLAAKFFGA
jgi:uncharacterized protein (DUF1697 family)